MTITSASFNGDVFPTDVVGEILATGLAGAPVFAALTQRTTTRRSMTFATGSPDGFDWTAELGTIPTVDPGDDSVVVSLAKISGMLLLSNEAVADSELNLTGEVGRLIAESMAAKADLDLVYGDDGVPTANAASPAGFFDDLTNVEETTLRASVVKACADIMTAGGTPRAVLLSPTLWADEMTRRETTPTAVGPLFADLGIPLAVTVASTLKATDALVLDTAGCFALTNTDYSIEASTEAGEAWSRDGLSLRVKARLAVAIPAPARHARSIAVDATP